MIAQITKRSTSTLALKRFDQYFAAIFHENTGIVVNKKKKAKK